MPEPMTFDTLADMIIKTRTKAGNGRIELSADEAEELIDIYKKLINDFEDVVTMPHTWGGYP